MCTCASCEKTDSFSLKSFAEWPRGDPAGKRSSESAYKAHVAHGRTWGRRPSGKMYLGPEFPGGVSLEPLRYRTPARADGGAHRAYPTAEDAKRGTAYYVAQFIAGNEYVTPEKIAKRDGYRAMVSREERAARKRERAGMRKPPTRLVTLARELRQAA